MSVRGVGPGLTAFGVLPCVLGDPDRRLLGTTQMASNENWETGTSIARR